MARSFGLDMQVIGPGEAKALFPYIDTAGLEGAEIHNARLQAQAPSEEAKGGEDERAVRGASVRRVMSGSTETEPAAGTQTSCTKGSNDARVYLFPACRPVPPRLFPGDKL